MNIYIYGQSRLIHREFSTLAISVLAVFIALTFISCTATPPGGGKDTLTSRAEEYASVYNSATWNHDPDKWTELFDFFAPEIQATCKGGEEGFGIATANAAAFGLGFLQLKANQVELRISKVKASGTEGTVKMSLHKQEALGGTQITDEDPLEWKLVDEKWWVNTELLNMYGELPPYCTAAPVAAVPSSVETDIGTKKTSETLTTESEIGNDLDKLIETNSCQVCDLSGAELQDAGLAGANLAGANLSGADLSRADLSRADLTGANLAGANLSGAELQDADLREANLTGAVLVGANLTEADLTGANLTNADLMDADLTRADLNGVDLTGADLTGAKLYATNLYDANLTGANLRNANMRIANLTEADLTGANLTNANLRDADLIGADLNGVDLTGADLRNANMRSANLSRANLTGANLTGARPMSANLVEADLTGADLTGANLWSANLDGVIGADFTGALNVPAKYLKD